jgi:hypothetical protein
MLKIILRRRRTIGALLSVIWVVGIGLYGLHGLAGEAHHQRMFCYRVRAEMRANPRCAVDATAKVDQLCAFKDADCESSFIAPADVAPFAAVALVPPIVVWICAFIFTRFARRRQRLESRSPRA